MPSYLSFTHCLLQNEIPIQVTLGTLSQAHNSDLTTIFNPSPLPSPQELRDFPWDNVDWLIVNEGEARSLFEALEEEPKGGVRVLSEIDVLQRLHELSSFSPSVNLVCTLGSRGVIAILASGDILDVPASKLDGPVKDTTGAGDCFTGYLVFGLMEPGSRSQPPGAYSTKSEVHSILERAVKAAGICVQRSGAMESIPLRVEVDTTRVA